MLCGYFCIDFFPNLRFGIYTTSLNNKIYFIVVAQKKMFLRFMKMRFFAMFTTFSKHAKSFVKYITKLLLTPNMPLLTIFLHRRRARSPSKMKKSSSCWPWKYGTHHLLDGVCHISSVTSQ